MPISATAGDTDSILGQEDPLQKEMGTCSSTLAWKIPWKEETGVLESMGLQRVTHDLVTQQPQTSQLFTILLLSLEYLLHVSGHQSFTKCRIKNKLVSKKKPDSLVFPSSLFVTRVWLLVVFRQDFLDTVHFPCHLHSLGLWERTPYLLPCDDRRVGRG